ANGARETQQRKRRLETYERVHAEFVLVERRCRVRRARNVARRSGEIDEASVREHQQSARRAKIVHAVAPENGYGPHDPLSGLQGIEAQLALDDGARVARLVTTEIQHELAGDHEYGDAKRRERVPNRDWNVTRTAQQRRARSDAGW